MLRYLILSYFDVPLFAVALVVVALVVATLFNVLNVSVIILNYFNIPFALC